MADRRRTYLSWVRHWSSTDMRFSTSVWSMEAAAWATVSMLIHLIYYEAEMTNHAWLITDDRIIIDITGDGYRRTTSTT